MLSIRRRRNRHLDEADDDQRLRRPSSTYISGRSISLISLLLLLLIVIFDQVQADVADHSSVPRGTNPTLYDAEDLVIQLDDNSFNDTVFCNTVSVGNSSSDALLDAADASASGEKSQQHCTAMVVEFYSDWCGHCRAYARVYKALAHDLRDWAGVLRLAAINCADPINLMTCRASGITHYPYIKYFPRNSTSMEIDDGNGQQLLRAFQSVAEMRDQFTRALLAEWDDARYPDWPNFEPLGEVETYGELWEGVEPQLNTLVVVFEPAGSLVGAQLLLDLAKHGQRLMARRSPGDSALASALQLVDLPTFAVFRRGERAPVFIAELRRLLLTEFDQYLHNDTLQAPGAALRTFSRRKGAGKNTEESDDAERTERECDAEPERCAKAYFVSELDMLKSVRIALFNDLQLVGGEHINGTALSALHNFVDLLANHFPHTTEEVVEGEDAVLVDEVGNSTAITAERFLNASGRARVVFSHLRDFIGDKLQAGVSVDAWRAEFARAEADQGNPFPVWEEWEHCKGSSPVLRGYTCGLWMVFHAVTVNAYRKAQDKDNGDSFHPVALLHAIRDWVGAFFACEHCRAHFLRMTTKTAKIESLVRRREDVFLYLWKAHNLVNGRLRGRRDTEDPLFPKYQFPPAFLCPHCRRVPHAARFEGPAVRDFLIRFYARIRPIVRVESGTGKDLGLTPAQQQEIEVAHDDENGSTIPTIIKPVAEQQKQ